MTAFQLIFYAFAGLAIFSGLMVVSSSNPVRGALFLVLTFFCMAGLWLLLQAEFLALILVLVYVGAVMTLFLFVVMMLSVSRVSLREGFVRYLPVSLAVILSVLALSFMVINPEHFGFINMPLPIDKGADFNNIASLGQLLYTDYVYPFEIAAVILLSAIVAAISLTHHSKVKTHKTQSVSAQIAVKREDRVRLVNMPATPKSKPTSGEE